MKTLKELLDWLRTARLACLGCGAELSGGEPKMYPHEWGVDGWWVYVECGKCGRQNAATHLLQLSKTAENELDFEPLTELWSTYRLSDGTKLKARPLLLRIYCVLEDGWPSMKFVFDRMFTVSAPKHLRGPPSRTAHTEETLKGFRRKAVGIVGRTEPWNAYLLQTGDTVKTRLRVTKVVRIVDAYDMAGSPFYEAATELIVEPSQHSAAGGMLGGRSRPAAQGVKRL